jgi:hypothetical protein
MTNCRPSWHAETLAAFACKQLADPLTPLDTQLQSLWLPAIRAQLALDRKNPADALNGLQAAVPTIELGLITFVINTSLFKTLHKFTGGTDGVLPGAGLIFDHA